MPTAQQETFYQTTVTAAKWEKDTRMEEFALAANQSIPEWGLIAQISSANANDVQTLPSTGATSGTFTLTVTSGSLTAATPPLAYNATAATIIGALNTAIQSLPDCQNCSWTATGGPINTTNVVLTAAGDQLNQPLVLISANNTLLVGGTVVPAHTTVGISNNSIVNYNGAIVANPTTAPALTAAGSDGTWAVGDYTVAYTYVTAGGETIPSYESSITLASTNHIAVASITSVPTGVVSVNVYVNGLFAKNVTVTSAATGAFTITAPASATDATPPPYVSTATVAGDGSQNAVGIAWYQMTAAASGRVTYGASTASGNNFHIPEFTGNVAIRGWFSAASINAASPLDARSVATLGRLINGSLSSLTNAMLAIYGG